jgi:hypothetical protein
MRHLLEGPVEASLTHPGKVRGGQFRNGVDLHAPGATVYAPFDAKIAHVHPDKTQCGNPGPNSKQFTLRQEYVNEKGDRKFTGLAVGVAHIEVNEGVGVGAGRHVKEGAPLGVVSGDSLHVAVNKHDRLGEVTGV